MKDCEPIATASPAEIEALIERLESGQVCAGDAQLVERLLRLVLVLLRVLSGKNASLARLKRLLFGTKSEQRMKAEAQEQTSRNEEADGEPRSEPSVRRPSVEPATREREKPGQATGGWEPMPIREHRPCAALTRR